MFSNNQLTRYGCLIVICLATILVIATDRSDSYLPDYGLSISTLPNAGPVGRCETSGTYTQYKSLQSNGTVSMHWSPSLPRTHVFKYLIRVNGYGWLDATLSHQVTSPRFGTVGSGSVTFTRSKVGAFWHFTVVPYASAVTEATMTDKITASYNNEGYDTYSWSASGTVTLQPVYWKTTAGYPFAAGSWENLGSATPHPYNSQGSWTLTGKLLCPKCSQDVTHFSQHQTTCGQGHSYWSCVASEVSTHESHTAGNANANAKSSNGGTTTSPTIGNNGGNGGNNGGNRICGNTWRGSGACIHDRVASSRTAHQSTCAAGHTYWSCNPSALSHHSRCTAPRSSTPSPRSSTTSSRNPPSSRTTSSRNDWRTRSRTCRRCGTSFTSYTQGSCSAWGRTYSSHWGTSD